MCATREWVRAGILTSAALLGGARFDEAVAAGQDAFRQTVVVTGTAQPVELATMSRTMTVVT
jgi:hypothetical protein